jgi:hypothetical protein
MTAPTTQLARKAVAAMLFTSMATVGCSLIVDTGAQIQCKTAEDCLKRGPDFVATLCETSGPAANTCVPVPEQEECTNNLTCVSSRGPGNICVRGPKGRRCEKIDYAACPRRTGDPEASDVHLIGMLGDFGPNDASYFEDNHAFLGAQLAIRHWNQKASLPSPVAGDPPKRAILLACTQSTPRTSARVLVNLGAVAIVGPTRDDALGPAAEQTVPGAVTMIGGWTSDTAVTSVPRSAGRVWLTSPVRSELMAPLSDVLDQAAAAIKQQVGGNPTALRVAVLVGSGNFEPFGPLADERLRFNGKTALENQGNYKRFSVDKTTPQVLANEVSAYAPNVIVAFASKRFGASYVGPLEAALKSASLKPSYVVPMYEEDDNILKNIGDRKRLLWLGPTRSPAYPTFVNAFSEAYKGDSAVGPRATLSAARAYEATQLVLYGMYATTQRTAVQQNIPGISPANFAVALSGGRVTAKSTDAIRVNAGINDILDKGLPALNSSDVKDSKDIRFVGLLSPLEMDTGGRYAPEGSWTTYCQDNTGAYVSGGAVFTKGKFDKSVGLCP